MRGMLGSIFLGLCLLMIGVVSFLAFLKEGIGDEGNLFC